jgi:hypothetical protein
MEQKLSYYQKNKETILAKRKLRREFERQERLRLGRPFMKFDDDDEITFDPSMNEGTCDVGEVDFVENVVISVVEPLEEVVVEPVVEKVAKKETEKVTEKKGKKKSKKRVSV